MTSDHGEQFWENGSWGHGQNLHDHQIHVPLLVFLPDVGARAIWPERAARGGRGQPLTQGAIEDQVELIDLYPTLLELLGVDLDGPVNGRSLVSLLEGQGSLPAREAFAEHTNVKENEQKALRTPRFKFIVSIPRKSSRCRRRELRALRPEARSGESRRTSLRVSPEGVSELRARTREDHGRQRHRPRRGGSGRTSTTTCATSSRRWAISATDAPKNAIPLLESSGWPT